MRLTFPILVSCHNGLRSSPPHFQVQHLPGNKTKMQVSLHVSVSGYTKVPLHLASVPTSLQVQVPCSFPIIPTSPNLRRARLRHWQGNVINSVLICRKDGTFTIYSART